MVGTPVGGMSGTTATLLSRHAAGGLFLHGRSRGDAAQVAALVSAYRDLATTPVPLLVATDQEGGRVQVLAGPGFSPMPSALGQVGELDLAAHAAGWARELAAAGVNVNLAPVADLVPAESAAANPPIGAIERNYGNTQHDVVVGAGAFALGLEKGMALIESLDGVEAIFITNEGEVVMSSGADEMVAK